jgi:Lipopolysaccharide kinase (Kdo/WaaP) family
MRAVHRERIERRGWRLVLVGAAAELAADRRERLVDVALAAAAGNGARRIRRSRHAESYLAPLDVGDIASEVFIKVLDAPRGIAALKYLFRPARVEHVASITAALNRDGFLTPPILLYGRETATGREVLATARAAGTLVPRSLRAPHAILACKRAMLGALGATIARMHRAGYLHGDLTPYNVLVTSASAPQYIFIDHERTRRSILSRWWRPRLRNLVQLGRFELRGLSSTDRMRVWRGYAAEIGAGRTDQRRAAAMLSRRIARDRGRIAPATAPLADIEPERR